MNRFLSRPGLAATASALLISALASLPMILSGHLTRDSGVFLYTGMAISRGGMPYVDSWDHKGPLLAAIEAVAWRLGGGIVGAPILEGVVLFIGLAVAGILWSRLIGYAAVPAVLLVGVTYLGVFEGGNFTETWLFPVQLVAYSAAAHLGLRFGREAPARATAAVGLLLGLALATGLFTRMNNVVGLALVVALGVVLLRRRLLFVVAVVATVVAVGAALALWLWTGDALRAGIDQYVRYNLFYSSGTTASDRLSAFGTLAQLLVSGAVVMAVLLLAGAWLARGRKADADGTPSFVAAMFFAVGGLDALSQMVSGRPYPHYLVVAIAGFAVAGVVLASRLRPLGVRATTPVERLRGLPRAIVAGGAVVLVLAASSSSALQWARIATGSGVFVAGSYQAQLVDRVVPAPAGRRGGRRDAPPRPGAGARSRDVDPRGIRTALAHLDHLFAPRRTGLRRTSRSVPRRRDGVPSRAHRRVARIVRHLDRMPSGQGALRGPRSVRRVVVPARG